MKHNQWLINLQMIACTQCNFSFYYDVRRALLRIGIIKYFPANFMNKIHKIPFFSLILQEFSFFFKKKKNFQVQISLKSLFFFFFFFSNFFFLFL
jgi:hypothetical protein